MKFVSTAKLSKNGLSLIKSFEGLRLTSYKVLPSEKYYTIGYGHYSSSIKEGMKITEKQAEQYLMKDLEKFVTGVNKSLKVVTNQQQFDSLVSLAFNIGLSAFNSSTLLKKLNKGDYIGASNEFTRWNKSGGKVVNGLTKRRLIERNLFRS